MFFEEPGPLPVLKSQFITPSNFADSGSALLE